MEKVIIWYGVYDGGDGSPYIKWFLTKQEVEDGYEEDIEKGWGGFTESGVGSVETFVGSHIYNKALKNKKIII